METKLNLVEPMLDKVKEYGKTSLELFKLKSVDKTADILSIVTSRLLFLLVGFIFLITLNIALGLWLGEVLGKSYYGFIVLTLLYGMVALIIYFKHPVIKAKVNDKLVAILID
jgi:uncharacterized membrane protein